MIPCGSHSPHCSNKEVIFLQGKSLHSIRELEIDSAPSGVDSSQFSSYDVVIKV